MKTKKTVEIFAIFGAIVMLSMVFVGPVTAIEGRQAEKNTVY